MVTTVAPARISLENLVEQILTTRKLTCADRQQLMLTLLANELTEMECLLIDRLLYGVRKGLLQVD